MLAVLYSGLQILSYFKRCSCTIEKLHLSGLGHRSVPTNVGTSPMVGEHFMGGQPPFIAEHIDLQTLPEVIPGGCFLVLRNIVKPRS